MPPFEVPAARAGGLAGAGGARGSAARQAWEQRAWSSPPARCPIGDPIDAAATLVRARRSPSIKAESRRRPPKIATRVASQKVLEKLVPALPALIGGSADLDRLNGTRTKHHTPVTPTDFAATTSTTACASTPWPRP